MNLRGFGVPDARQLRQGSKPLRVGLLSAFERMLKDNTPACRYRVQYCLAGLHVLARLTADRQALDSTRRLIRAVSGGRPADQADQAQQCIRVVSTVPREPDNAAPRQEAVAEDAVSRLSALLVDARVAALASLASGEGGIDRQCGGDTVSALLFGSVNRKNTRSSCSAVRCRDLLEASERHCSWQVRLYQQWAGQLEPLMWQAGEPAFGPVNCRPVLLELFSVLSALRSAGQLRCLPVQDGLLRQGLMLIMMHLRCHGEWPGSSVNVLLRQLLVIQWSLYCAATGAAAGVVAGGSAGGLAGNAGKAGCMEPADVLRHAGRYLSAWRRHTARQAARRHRQLMADTALRELAATEIRQDIRALRHHRLALDGAHVPSALCNRLSALFLNLHAAGNLRAAWLADSLQHALLAALQRRQRLDGQWQGVLRRLCEEVLCRIPGQRCIDSLLPDCSADHLHPARLEVRTGPTAQQSLPGVGRQAAIALTDHLPDRMRLLPRPDRYLKILSLAPGHAPESVEEHTAADPERRQLSRLAQLRAELVLLQYGAHQLKVHRIEAVVAVMLLLYERWLPEGSGTIPDGSGQVLRLLRRAHAGLLRRLDQAAAWQVVDPPRPLLDRLYRQIERLEPGSGLRRREDEQGVQEDGACQRPGYDSSARQCRLLNRRVQSLLKRRTHTADADGRLTVLLTLLQDQERLLEEMANRNGGSQPV